MADERMASYIPYAEEAEKPINLKYYLFLFQKSFYVTITFFVIVVTFAAIYASKISDRYTAGTQIMVERPQMAWNPGASGGGEGGEGESFTADYYATQTEIMHSTAVMKQVGQELKLGEYLGIEDEDLIAGRVEKMVSIKRVPNTRLFNIIVNADSPQMAASVANAVARAYIRKNFENMLYYSKEILAWLPQKDKPENNTNATISVEDPFGNVKQVTREELIESLPSIQTDATIRSFREKKNFQEAELQQLLKQFREKYPLVIKARANLKFLDESIQMEKMRVIDGLKTQAEGRFKAGQVRIIEEAKITQKPVKNNRLMIILMAGIGELVFSMLIILLLDYFDDTIRSLEDFERKGILLPFLGPVPFLKGKTLDPSQRKIGNYYKNSEVAESFRYLRVAINFSASPESLKTLAFTSCLPHEGKSFSTHNIAISFAMDGNRTLLVDADMRRPVVHTTFQMNNVTGLSNFLTSKIELDTVIKESFIENLSIITAGPVSPNPGEILSSDRMKFFLEETRKRYDRVIIDCPPLTGIGDAYVVGNILGQVIMVIHAGRTPVDLIKHTQKQLDKSGVKILGVILSMVDMEKERHAGYSKHYYHTYTRYYQQDQA